ncbi:MAG TPA: fibrobacter succinogenes major paralogous domain-containing protein [Salinivirgaceae bacterium]|nr:fibrobacter succinogenes major paralogous domain-containing protein [Salinivirgaceae bacterium]
MKKTLVLLLMIATGMVAAAQVERLSEDNNPPQKPSQPQEIKDISITIEFPEGYKAENFDFDAISYLIIRDKEQKRYALFFTNKSEFLEVLLNPTKWNPIETVTDIDGNTYNAVRIGKYVWMLQNLKTTKYNNGKAITHSPSNNEAWTSPQGAYTFVENKAENKDNLGLLYSWYAATNSQGICPKGWRVPSETEWKNLIDFVGGSAKAGLKLKSKNGWKPMEDSNKNTAGTNSYLFDAKPTGYRQMHKEKFNFWQVGGEATFWTSTSKTEQQAISVVFTAGDVVNMTMYPKEWGRSVRCIKD